MSCPSCLAAIMLTAGCVSVDSADLLANCFTIKASLYTGRYQGLKPNERLCHCHSLNSQFYGVSYIL